jgi:hypothetical protein
MKFTLLELTLNKPITSYGHLNLVHQEEDSTQRDIQFKEEEIGVIEKILLTNWSTECYDDYLNKFRTYE